MDRFMMWSIVASVCIVLLAFGGAATLVWMMAGALVDCAETDFTAIPSPGGQFEAVVHEVDCGATTPFNTQISVVKHILGYETSRDTLFVVDGQYVVPVRWLDETTLAVGVPAGERVYRKEAAFEGGRVVYEEGVVVPPRKRTPP
jgi:hypothetical protein